MINYSELMLLKLTQNQEMPSDSQIQQIKESIPTYKYPIGILAQNSFASQKFKKDTIEHTYEYIKLLITTLLSDYYSQDEIKLCSLFFTCNSAAVIQINANFYDNLSYTINENSDKKEIQFIIEELQYKYIMHLFYTDSMDEQLDPLIEHLASIEKVHNSFILGDKGI